MVKKMLAWLLTICMMFSIMPATVFAAEITSTPSSETTTEAAVENTDTEEQDSNLPATISEDASGDASASEDSGLNTEEDSVSNEVIIASAEDLQDFAAAVTAGDNFAGKVVKLAGDIDLTGIVWTPIGGDNVYFKGEFDGQGHTISNMTSEGTRLGLFGLVEYAYIHDFTMKNVTLTTTGDNARVGAVAANLQYWNVVENVTIDGINITLNHNDALAGAVAGYVWKSQLGNVDVKNATITVNGTGNVVGGNTGYGRAHVWDTGVTGNNANWLDGTVQTIDGTEYVLQNYFTGCDIETITINLNGTGNEAGGFFGSDTYNSHSNYFQNCHVTGLAVNCADGTSQTVGGFIAWNNGTTSAGTAKGFDGCSVTGTINGANGIYGGFVGQVGGRACSYVNATADVDITCTGTAGGFVGITQAYSTHLYTFTDCAAKGDVTANVAGGFAGKNGLSGDGKSVYVAYTDCSASGAVNGTSIAGGFVGQVDPELPGTNWNIVDSTGALELTRCTASASVQGAGQVAGLIGYVDSVANGDAGEGNKIEVTLTDNTYTGIDINKSDDTSDGHIVSVKHVAKVGDVYYGSLTEAVTAANAIEGSATVTLLQDVTLGEKLTISGNVTIAGEHTITRAVDYTGTLFAVSADAALTLDGGLTIDGANNWTFDQETYDADLANMTKVPSDEATKYFALEDGAPVATAYMITTAGTVNLNDVTITNHYSNGSGIVSASKGANVTLTGAQITHCANAKGSGLVVNASAGVYDSAANAITVTMNEGTVIDGNHVGGNHGVFKIYMGTTFTMNGGEVKNTTGWNSNGVVVGIYWANFIMNGGTICSNSSVGGPNNGRNAAIYVHNSSTFTMNDGTICHNTGAYGGVDAPKSNSTTTIKGGSIINNYSYINSKYTDIYAIATTTIYGGTYTQDVTQWLAPNLILKDNSDGTWGVTDNVAAIGDTNYTSIQAAVNTAQDGDTITVLGSHNIADTIIIPEGKNVTIDLNEKTVTTIVPAGTEDNVVTAVRVQGTLTVKNGTINAQSGADYCFIVGGPGTDTYTNGKLTIESGNYYGACTAVSVTNGVAEIKDGYFEVTEADGADAGDFRYLLNCIDSTYDAGTASIVVTGGTFKGYDPANNAAEGTGTNFVADGYESVDNQDGTWTVMKGAVAEANGVKYTSIQDAIYSVESGEDVTVKVIADHIIDTNGKNSLVYTNGRNVNLDLNGKVVTFDYTAKTNTDTVWSSIYVNGGSTLTVIDSSSDNTGKIYNKGDNHVARIAWIATNSTMIIEEGNYVSEQTDTMFYTSSASGRTTKTQLLVKGGTFNQVSVAGSQNDHDCFNMQDNSASYQYIELTGGTYNEDPRIGRQNSWEVTIPEGYFCQDNGDGTWTVVDYVEWIKGELLAGRSVTLEQDITVSGKYVDSIPAPTNGNGYYPNPGIFNVVGDVDVTFDLNGHTITYVGHEDAEYNAYNTNVVTNTCTIAHGLFYTNNGANLTIVDNSEAESGKVVVNGLASGVYSGSPNSVITVEGGDWINNGCVDCGGTNLFLYASHGGELYIKDGRFEQALDAEGNSYLIVEHGGESKNSVIDYSKTKIEISGGTFVGMDPEEAVFIDQGNGQAMSKTNVVAEGYFSGKIAENTWTVIPAGFVAVNVEDNEYFTTVTEALNKADSGETVKLVTNVEGELAEALILVYEGRTLDLNGYTLETGHLVGFNTSNVIDSSADKTGLLKAGKNSIVLSSTNAEMPVWNGTDGYLFASLKMQVQGSVNADGSIRCVYRPSFGSTVNKNYLSDGASDNGINIKIRLTWDHYSTDDTGNEVYDATRSQDFIYTEDLVKDVYANGRTFTFVLSGYSNYENMKVFAVVESELGVECIKEITIPSGE